MYKVFPEFQLGLGEEPDDVPVVITKDKFD